MTTILIFFVAHWYLSLFFQTFYLHRYGAHHLFIMNKFWEKFFHAMTYISQGSSFLSPRAYAVLHRMHHAYSDSEKDPHSPHYSSNVFTMMWKTKDVYNDYLNYRKMPEDRFAKDLPEYPLIDRIGDTWVSRVAWGTAYSLFYIHYVPAGMWYLYFLLPIHFLMGPVHGAIVNWCGHMYGYSNYDNNDKSKNSLVFDLLMGGELFQNNHHKFPTSAKFSAQWFEFDPSYPVIWLMTKVGIIKMNPKPLEIDMF